MNLEKENEQKNISTRVNLSKLWLVSSKNTIQETHTKLNPQQFKCWRIKSGKKSITQKNLKQKMVIKEWEWKLKLKKKNRGKPQVFD
jgi:hypothetical protein